MVLYGKSNMDRNVRNLCFVVELAWEFALFLGVRVCAGICIYLRGYVFICSMSAHKGTGISAHL